MNNKLTFPKEEKLKSRKMISKIFSEGHVVKSYPIRIQFVFHDLNHTPRCQVGASVPKRNFKSAVDRNRIKRQIKEAYRINKIQFIKRLEQFDKKIAFMIVFSGSEMQSFETIQINLIKAMDCIRI